MPLDLVEGQAVAAPYHAPGLDAPLKPTGAQRATVEALQASTIARLQRLEAADLSALSAIMQRAQGELALDLRRWIEKAPDGEYRWTAQRYRNAITALDDLAAELGTGLRETMTETTEAILAGSLKDVRRDLARFSDVFPGAQQALASREAAVLASGRAFLIPRFKTSAARYQGNVRDDIQRRLAVDILKGAPLRETIERLVASGGPRGLVALRGIVGEPGAIVERIPEGLFARYRFWSDRVVRTEYAAAHNFTTGEAHREIAEEAGVRVVREWITAPAPCPVVCEPLDGKEADTGKPFQSTIGPIDVPPAHPYCRCTTAVSHVVAPRKKRQAAPPKPEAKPAGFPWPESALKSIPVKLDGMHEKAVFEAPDGVRWLFKPQPEFRALADKAAADLAGALGVPTAEVHVVTLGGRTGSIQRMFAGVAGDMDGHAFESLTDRQVQAIQREHVFDWLISQHDSHRANLLRLDSGDVVGIDNGQTFRFFGSDRLDLAWGAPGKPNHSPTVYHSLFGHYAGGGEARIGPHDKGTPLADLVKRVESMPDAEFRRHLEGYARAVEAAAKLDPDLARASWAGKMTADQFLDKVLERKRALRSDVDRFYGELAAARTKATAGTTDDKAAKARWAKRLKVLDAAGHRGVGFTLGAGDDVENAAGLLFGIDGNGTIAEFRLRGSGWSKLAAAIQKMPGGAGASVAKAAGAALRPGEKFAADNWEYTLKIVKSFNYHLKPGGDGQVPAHVETLFLDLVGNLKRAIAEAGKKGSGVSPEDGQAAAHFLGVLSSVNPTLAPGGWNKAALGKLFDTWRPSTPAAASKTSTAGPLSGWSAARVDSGQVHGRQLRAGKIVKTGPATALASDAAGCWRLTSPDGVQVYVYGHDDKTGRATAGRIRLAVDDAAAKVTPATVERALASLRALGLETREATEDELAALHLRKYAYRLRLEAEARTKVPATLPADEQRRRLVDLLRPHLPGVESAKLGPVTERGDLHGWHRFYDESGLLTKWPWFNDYRLHHAMGDGVDTLAQLLEGGGEHASIVSRIERERVGITGKVSGVSGSSTGDFETGGASYVFTRVKTTAGAMSSPGLVFRARSIFADLDTWSVDEDTYGNTAMPGESTWGSTRYHQRSTITERAHLADLAKRRSNETMIKHSINLAEHLDAVVVRNDAERARAVELFHRAGLAVVRGKPIEDLIHVAR